MTDIRAAGRLDPITVVPAEESHNEKKTPDLSVVPLDAVTAKQAEFDLALTEEHFVEAQVNAESLTLEEVKDVIQRAFELHEFDPNFLSQILGRMREFLGIPDIFESTEKHAELIQLMRLEAAVLTTNSPYAEVRAVVDNTDDVNIPCSTIRSWIIGILFVLIIAFMNQLFSIRQPSISVGADVAQLLSYPVGKAFEKCLPDIGFTLFGVRHSLNPGPFSKKEHMLITIMATVGFTLPSSRYIIFTQFLERYFNQPYSASFGYQILLALSTDLMGYGLAGFCRKILVYPSYCIFPKSLVTIALNRSLHEDVNTSVRGPLRKIFSISRFRFFIYTFLAMLVYFWFPDHIFTALSAFNWLAWIAPNNINLTAITGIKKGLGFNPLPTFDWNIVTHSGDPLVIPYMATINKFAGVVLCGLAIIGMWYTNSLNTGYLPINTSTLYNHNATTFNVTRILDSRGWLDEAKYQAYSPPFMSATSLMMYFFSFAMYGAIITHAYLYHRNEIAMGFRNLFKKIKGKKEFDDVHNKLMAKYPEVSEWWYLGLNLIAVALGIGVITGWQTYTTVGVIFLGILLALVFVIPAGVIFATTGILLEMNFLAEFIGGVIQPGNALAMNFFKCYGYVTTAHAVAFVNDLKLAHYVKIPPKHAFWAQVIATVVSAFVCTGVQNFQMLHIPNVCESNQKNRFTCPGVNVYFSAAVLFGSLGAKKVFGKGGQYVTLMSAFPIGFFIPVILYFVQKRVSKTHWARRIHPVALLAGGVVWTPPYNISYFWPAVPFAWYSMVHLKTKYLGFWSKYNYVLSASWSIAIAIAALIMFFALEWTSVSIDWWGNNADSGCETTTCLRLKLPKGEYFGPRIGSYT